MRSHAIRRTLVPAVGLVLILAGQVSSLSAESAEELVQQGMQALNAGDFKKAEQVFTLAAQRDPSGTNFEYLAVSESSLGHLDQAIVHFRRSMQLGNDTAGVHYGLGLTYLKLQQRPPGIRELQRAVALDPELKSARYSLAVALVEAGRPGEAIPHLTALRKQSALDPEILANLVRAQFENKDEHAALETVDQAVEAMPSNVALIVTLAELCARHHQVQKARHLLENASEIRAEDPDLKLVLAKISLEGGDPIEALAVLKDIPADRGRAGEVQLMRGVALGLTGQLDSAASELSSAVQADPENPRYLLTQAWGYQLEGKHDDALSVLHQARSLDPRNPVIPHRMAVSYFYLHQYDKAVEACQAAVGLNSRYDPSYLLLGVAKLKLDDFHAAQAALERALGLQPDVALYHREMGVALFMAGSWEESKKQLDRALTLDPKEARAYFWRGKILARRGDRARAIADLELAVALKPGYMDAYSELAKVYAADGQPQKVLMILTKQKELKAESSSDDLDPFLSQLSDPLP